MIYFSGHVAKKMYWIILQRILYLLIACGIVMGHQIPETVNKTIKSALADVHALNAIGTRYSSNTNDSIASDPSTTLSIDMHVVAVPMITPTSSSQDVNMSATAAAVTATLASSSTTRTRLSSSSAVGGATSVATQQQQQRQQQHKTSGVKPSPPKIHKTDAPMLNYIFDSHSTANKHHHHDHSRYGPHFDDISSVGNITNITVQVSGAVYLNCRISLLQDKTVSWVRRKHGEHDLQLLTVGMHTYSGDTRYTMEFQYPNNWRLKIASAIKDDEGTYECQISTHPPRVILIHLFVNDPKVLIIDEKGIPLQDKYYEVDSTMQLSCIVRHVAMTSAVVFWSHGERILNYDITRGGVSVKTEIMEEGANSTLSVARINKSDSGNYTCSINSSHDYTVSVHVLNGESFAELHHGDSHSVSSSVVTIFLLNLVLILGMNIIR